MVTWATKSPSAVVWLPSISSSDPPLSYATTPALPFTDNALLCPNPAFSAHVAPSEAVPQPVATVRAKVSVSRIAMRSPPVLSCPLLPSHVHTRAPDGQELPLCASEKPARPCERVDVSLAPASLHRLLAFLACLTPPGHGACRQLRARREHQA